MFITNCRIAGLAIPALCFMLVSPVRAGLFSSISYNQQVDAFGSSTQGQGIYKYLNGTTLPVSQSVSVTSDATITASYSFTDNGTTAAININCQAALSALNENADEASDSYIIFTVSQPVSYTASFADIVSGDFSGDDSLALLDPGYLFSFNQAHNSSFSYSGVLSSGKTYYLDEGWDMSNTAGGSATGTGSDAVSLTLTAVPEPSSFFPMTILGTSLLSRRKRLPQ